MSSRCKNEKEEDYDIKVPSCLLLHASSDCDTEQPKNLNRIYMEETKEDKKKRVGFPFYRRHALKLLYSER